MIPELYSALKEFGSNSVTHIAISNSNSFNSDEIGCMEFIWRTFKDYSAAQLRNISHANNTPWKQVWTPGSFFIEIPDELTRQYYKNLLVHAT